MATLGNLLKAQVERSRDKGSVVVQFAATIPGDGSQVSADWWLRQANTALATAGVPFCLEFADLDRPTQLVSEGESSAIKLTQLKRQLEEAKAYIRDLEDNMREKAEQIAESMGNQKTAGLTRSEMALKAVEEDGYFYDEQRSKWVDIATEAKRLGLSYITVWRAAKRIGINRVEAWVVGDTQAGGERLLVKQGSFAKGQRKKKGRK